jgi:hypothetical protein
MKKLLMAVLIGVAAGTLLVSGCSKSKEGAKSAANSSDSATMSTAASGDSAEIRAKWVVGNKYLMRMELNQSVETKIPGQPEPVRQQVNLTQDFNMAALKELPDDGRQLDLEFKNETMEVSIGGNPVLSFDSTKSAAEDSKNPITPLLRKMVGAHITYFVDRAGKVEKMEGVDELMKRVGFNRKSQEHAMFKQMFSEATLKQYGSLGETMPNRSIKVGDSWPMKREIYTDIGLMTLDMKCTFKNWEQHGDRKCAHILTEGEILSGPSTNAVNPTAKIEKGKLSSEMWFDPELGMSIESETNQKMTVRIITGGQTIVPQIIQKIRVMLVDVKSR